MYGIQFVHFIFGEADRAELGNAQTDAEDYEESTTADDGPIKSSNETEALNSPIGPRVYEWRRRANFEIPSHCNPFEKFSRKTERNAKFETKAKHIFFAVLTPLRETSSSIRVPVVVSLDQNALW